MPTTYLDMSDMSSPTGSKRKTRTADLVEADRKIANHVKRHSIVISEINGKSMKDALVAPELADAVRVTFRDITAAAFRIKAGKSGLEKTPLMVRILFFNTLFI